MSMREGRGGTKEFAGCIYYVLQCLPAGGGATFTIGNDVVADESLHGALVLYIHIEGGNLCFSQVAKKAETSLS